MNGVPNGWAVRKVGELADVARGSSPRPIADQRYFDGGNIPWVKIADATKSGKYLYDTKEKVNEFGASFSKRLPAGSLIIAASGTLGYPQMLGVPGCVHDGWLYLTRFRDVDKHFLYYFFHWKKQHFYNSAYGAAIQNINTDILRNTDISLPPLPVQERIASILSAYDDLIENNNRRTKILEEMTRMIYRQWFVNFRFPGHRNVTMVESDLGPIPTGWQALRFTEVTKVLSGGTPKTNVPEFWNGEIPFFGPVDAPTGFFVTQTEKSITSLGLSHCNSKLYPAETVFITARGTVGKVALPARDMAMNQSCYALCGRSGLSQLFLFMLTKECAEELKKKAHGAVFDTITIETFSKLSVVLPAAPLPQRFELVVRPFFSLMLTLHRSATNLRQTRDLLLPKLISGELSVEAAEQEAVAQGV
jgi:type I restriction enzyme, S subunit